MLAALPRLGLSYGPVDLPLALITAVRFGLVVVAVLMLAAARSGRRTSSGLLVFSLAMQVGLSAVAFYGLYIEPFRLTMTEINLGDAHNVTDQPLRIMHLSDFHVERTTRRERGVIAEAIFQQPDLILLTGDYVNMDYLNDAQSLQDSRFVLSQLQAPFGVYAVLGTTDTPRVVADVLVGLDIHLLNDELVILAFPQGEITLVGVTCCSPQRDRRALEDLMLQVPSGAYTILLYHTPDLIETASALGVDLYLAGHTHGGQVRLPFYGAMVTFSEYGKQYEMGPYLVSQTLLYVNRGLGMEGFGLPRARFLCPPEIGVFTLGE